jgi:uncharacterized surface protein with fasciclin (FAS1) repeats
MTTKDNDIVEKAANAGTFNHFGEALKASGLAGTFKGLGPFTLFAPTDEAFEKIPPGALRRLLENKVQIAAIVNNHVVPGVLSGDELRGSEPVSRHGQVLTIASNDAGFTVNGARLTRQVIEASNGVIHAIDTVMLPEPV